LNPGKNAALFSVNAGFAIYPQNSLLSPCLKLKFEDFGQNSLLSGAKFEKSPVIFPAAREFVCRKCAEHGKYIRKIIAL
jgi:hypothetical protein